MRRLPLGKIPIGVLESTVLGLTGARSESAVTPAKAGLDFGAVKLPGGYLVVSADPITGVSEEIGRYAVKVSANDVATSGNRPQFAESVILLPEGSTRTDLEKVARQIHDAAMESGITILGGHTEVTPGLGHPIVVVTVFSLVKEFITSGGAQEGDTLMMTKTAGLEGTAELARGYDFSSSGVDAPLLKRARKLIGQIDVTEEAVRAFETRQVHAMHDCTEGGVLGAVFEMSLASGVGFRLNEAAVPVAQETRKICSELSIDPLRLIGSGSLLLAVEKGAEDDVKRALRSTCRVTKIGQFVRSRREIVTKDGGVRLVKEAPEDELWRMISRRGGGRHRL
ncbi:MAG: hypothetical protein KGI38_00030 [Thaumarchaeota archaeon]|nr:hypothetical protein [Nitrososphaerota archaeon]